MKNKIFLYIQEIRFIKFVKKLLLSSILEKINLSYHRFWFVRSTPTNADDVFLVLFTIRTETLIKKFLHRFEYKYSLSCL